MNTTITERRDNAVRIKIELTKEDYQAGVKRELNKLSREMSLPGFRKGNVPKQIIQKRYGTEIQTEVVADLAAKELDRVVEEEKLKVYGQPLPDYESIEVLAAAEPVLEFSVPLVPADMDFDFAGKSFKAYEVEIPDSFLTKELTRLQEANATLVPADEIGKDSILRGDLREMEGEQPKEGGLQKDGILLLMDSVKDKEESDTLLAANKGDAVLFHPYKAMGEDIQAFRFLLSIPEEEAEAYKDSTFEFRIETVEERKKAGLGKDFYSKVFGEDKVRNKEEALAEIRRVLEAEYKSHAEYVFITEVMQYLKAEKMPKVNLDADLIYRVYMQRFMEDVRRRDEKEAMPTPASKEEVLKYTQQFSYMDALQEKQAIELSDEEVQNFAKSVLREELRNMGLHQMGEDFVDQMLQYRLRQDPSFIHSLQQNLRDQKVILSLRDQFTLEPTKVSPDQFKEVVEKAQEANTAKPEAEEGTPDKEEEK